MIKIRKHLEKMSYAIIRNTKYKRENLRGIFRHNEIRNQIYY